MKMSLADVEAHQRHHGFTTEEPKPAILPLIVSSEERIDFFMEFEPPQTTSQQGKGERIVIPKVGRPFIHHFIRKESEEAAKRFDQQLSPFVPSKPFIGPIRLVAEWTWTWRTSEPKGQRLAGWKWKDTKPDAGNAQKLLEDRMQALGFFANDAQIASQTITKSWGDRPGIRITLESLQQP